MDGNTVGLTSSALFCVYGSGGLKERVMPLVVI